MYFLIVIVTLVIGMGAQGYVSSQLKKYKAISSSFHMSGADMAHKMLADNGLVGVAVNQGGPDQNFFDPRTNAVTLDPDVYNGSSITAVATACHEVGHAIQFAHGYAPLKLRSAMVPVVNMVSNAWIWLFMLGVFMQMLSLVWIAIAAYAAAVFFQIVTLPVEFDASRRAMVYLKASGTPQGEYAGTYSVLRACALTYVAAALVAVLNLVYLVTAYNRD